MELIYIYYAAVFYLGTILGSFLNVVALDIQKLFEENDLEDRNEFAFFARHWTKKYFWQSLMNRRSHCDNCQKVLKSRELFPLFSFALQRGTCKNCGDKITMSHFIVEIAAGFYFLGIFYTLFAQSDTLTNTFVWSVVYWFTLFGTLFVIALFDYRTQLIPDILIGFAGLLALGYVASQPLAEAVYLLGTAGLFAAIFYGMWAVSAGRWIGFADGKLALVTGLLLGFSAGFTALAVSFWAGAGISVGLLLIGKILSKGKLSFDSAVPFGPFMVFGVWYVFVFGLNLFQINIF